MWSPSTTRNLACAFLLLLTTLALIACGGSGLAAPTALSYPTLPAYTVGDTISQVTPTVTGTVTTYTLDQGLPAGFAFDATTGQISGTAYPVTPTTTYTVTAKNAAGSTRTQITITVNDKRPVFTYDSQAVGYSVGIEADDQSPTMDLIAGGPGLHWTIDPALPPGLLQ